ncbi:MAG: hypothetical protein FJ267_05445 [Planctomycetes bacterium]|nr:hypothetical protein [Planctomycetota bacterium]
MVDITSYKDEDNDSVDVTVSVPDLRLECDGKFSPDSVAVKLVDKEIVKDGDMECDTVSSELAVLSDELSSTEGVGFMDIVNEAEPMDAVSLTVEVGDKDFVDVAKTETVGVDVSDRDAEMLCEKVTAGVDDRDREAVRNDV